MTTTLRHGEFFGYDKARRKAAGFQLAVMTPELPPERVPLHTHEAASFVFPFAGAYISSAKGAGDALERPTLIYNPPGTTHRDRFPTLAGGRFLTISVSDDTFREVAAEVRLPSPATSFRRPDLLLIAHRIVRECMRWRPASAPPVEALCLELMANAGHEPQPRSGQPPLWLEHAKNLLYDQCTESLRITDAARLMGIHPVQFVRTFRRFVQCTPGDFIRRARVEKAAALLRDTALPLSDIALRTGFADQSHFSKVFRRIFGVSPGAYRRGI
jgi:AraC family transcriptional regulator